MFGIVIFLTAFTSILSSAIGTKDIQDLLNSLQSQNARVTTSDESSSSSSSNDRISLVEQLRNMDLKELLQIANQLKASLPDDQRQRVLSSSYSGIPRGPKNLDKPEYDGNRYTTKEQLLQKLLHKKKPTDKFTHQHLSPNSWFYPNLLQNNDGWERTGALNEYSKIYVILDPKTLKNSAYKDGASNLLSRILNQISSTSEEKRLNRSKTDRYKGFLVKDGSRSRRYRRESKEGKTYGGVGGSMDDDYRPKRVRAEHTGAGGGGGGRTAIPYIRHRGDIYERD